MPDGYRLEWWGEQKASGEARAALVGTIPGCLLRLDGCHDRIWTGLRDHSHDGPDRRALRYPVRYQDVKTGLSCLLIFAGAHTRPALERSGKVALIGKPDHKRNLCLRKITFSQVLLGQFPTSGFKYMPIIGAFRM